VEAPPEVLIGGSFDATASLLVLKSDPGEGALQALRGSSVGLGTDIGKPAV